MATSTREGERDSKGKGLGDHQWEEGFLEEKEGDETVFGPLEKIYNWHLLEKQMKAMVQQQQGEKGSYRRGEMSQVCWLIKEEENAPRRVGSKGTDESDILMTEMEEDIQAELLRRNNHKARYMTKWGEKKGRRKVTGRTGSS